MAILEITNAHLASGADRLILSYIESVMFWPDDREKRRAAMKAARAEDFFQAVEFYKNRPKSHPVKKAEFTRDEVADTMMFLKDAPRMADIKKNQKSYTAYGMAAGWILFWVIAWHELKSPKATLTAAKANAAKMVDVSKSSIENLAWKRYRPVSSMWAAAVFMGAQKVKAGKQPEFPCKIEELGRFLALSEWFRRKGEKFVPRQSRRGPILKAGESWRPTSSLALPAVEPEFIKSPKGNFYTRG